MKILFFAPHSAIWLHAFPEALIAEALCHSGHKIVYVTCGRQLKAGCVAMSAYGVSSDASSERKAEVCRRCEGNKRLLRNEFGFSGGDLSEELRSEDIAEITRLLASVKREALLDLEVAGIPVGRLAFYEFLLAHKKSTIDFDDEEEWRDYLAALENTLYATYAGKRLIERESPDAVVVYNALYSVNRAVCKVAEAKGIPYYFMHAGGNLAHRLQTLMLSKGDTFSLLSDARAAWSTQCDTPIDAESAHAITDHFLELLKGRSVFAYSSPKTGETASLRRKFSIAPDQKVLCAALSSYDERFAAETINALEKPKQLLFPQQADWVAALIDYARARPDRYIIIRVHPRDFPNKRDSVKSAHANRLETLLESLPENVIVNWPTDNLSLYDLAEIVDVFLNSWSSVGKEMSLLGLPVVLYSPDLPLYPAEINYLGTTHASYFDAIERALADGWRYENIVRTYRWCAIEYGRMLVDISDGFGASEHLPAGFMARVRQKLMRTLDPFRQQRHDCRRRPRPIRAQNQISSLFESGEDTLLDVHSPTSRPAKPCMSEDAILYSEIGRIIEAMYPNGNARESKLGRLLMSLTERQHAASA